MSGKRRFSSFTVGNRSATSLSSFDTGHIATSRNEGASSRALQQEDELAERARREIPNSVKRDDLVEAYARPISNAIADTLGVPQRTDAQVRVVKVGEGHQLVHSIGPKVAGSGLREDLDVVVAGEDPHQALMDAQDSLRDYASWLMTVEQD